MNLFTIIWILISILIVLGIILIIFKAKYLSLAVFRTSMKSLSTFFFLGVLFVATTSFSTSLLLANEQIKITHTKNQSQQNMYQGQISLDDVGTNLNYPNYYNNLNEEYYSNFIYTKLSNPENTLNQDSFKLGGYWQSDSLISSDVTIDHYYLDDNVWNYLFSFEYNGIEYNPVEPADYMTSYKEEIDSRAVASGKNSRDYMLNQYVGENYSLSHSGENYYAYDYVFDSSRPENAEHIYMGFRWYDTVAWDESEYVDSNGDQIINSTNEAAGYRPASYLDSSGNYKYTDYSPIVFPGKLTDYLYLSLKAETDSATEQAMLYYWIPQIINYKNSVKNYIFVKTFSDLVNLYKDQIALTEVDGSLVDIVFGQQLNFGINPNTIINSPNNSPDPYANDVLTYSLFGVEDSTDPYQMNKIEYTNSDTDLSFNFIDDITRVGDSFTFNINAAVQPAFADNHDLTKGDLFLSLNYSFNDSFDPNVTDGISAEDYWSSNQIIVQDHFNFFINNLNSIMGTSIAPLDVATYTPSFTFNFYYQDTFYAPQFERAYIYTPFQYSKGARRNPAKSKKTMVAIDESAFLTLEVFLNIIYKSTNWSSFEIGSYPTNNGDITSSRKYGLISQNYSYFSYTDITKIQHDRNLSSRQMNVLYGNTIDERNDFFLNTASLESNYWNGFYVNSSNNLSLDEESGYTNIFNDGAYWPEDRSTRQYSATEQQIVIKSQRNVSITSYDNNSALANEILFTNISQKRVEFSIYTRQIIFYLIIVIFILINFIIVSLVLSRQIKKQSKELGTLKALGYKRKTIATSYLVYPILIVIIGGLFGTIIAFFIKQYVILPTLANSFSMAFVPLIYSINIFIIAIMLPLLILLILSFFKTFRMLNKNTLDMINNVDNVKPSKRVIKTNNHSYKKNYPFNKTYFKQATQRSYGKSFLLFVVLFAVTFFGTISYMSTDLDRIVSKSISRSIDFEGYSIDHYFYPTQLIDKDELEYEIETEGTDEYEYTFGTEIENLVATTNPTSETVLWMYTTDFSSKSELEAIYNYLKTSDEVFIDGVGGNISQFNTINTSIYNYALVTPTVASDGDPFDDSSVKPQFIVTFKTAAVLSEYTWEAMAYESYYDYSYDYLWYSLNKVYSMAQDWVNKYYLYEKAKDNPAKMLVFENIYGPINEVSYLLLNNYVYQKDYDAYYNSRSIGYLYYYTYPDGSVVERTKYIRLNLMTYDVLTSYFKFSQSSTSTLLEETQAGADDGEFVIPIIIDKTTAFTMDITEEDIANNNEDKIKLNLCGHSSVISTGYCQTDGITSASLEIVAIYDSPLPFGAIALAPDLENPISGQDRWDINNAPSEYDSYTKAYNRIISKKGYDIYLRNQYQTTTFDVIDSWILNSPSSGSWNSNFTLIDNESGSTNITDLSTYEAGTYYDMTKISDSFKIVTNQILLKLTFIIFYSAIFIIIFISIIISEVINLVRDEVATLKALGYSNKDITSICLRPYTSLIWKAYIVASIIIFASMISVAFIIWIFTKIWIPIFIEWVAFIVIAFLILIINLWVLLFSYLVFRKIEPSEALKE